jgi:hypothetical protein
MPSTVGAGRRDGRWATVWATPRPRVMPSPCPAQPAPMSRKGFTPRRSVRVRIRGGRRETIRKERGNARPGRVRVLEPAAYPVPQVNGKRRCCSPLPGAVRLGPPTIPKGARQSHHRHTTFDTYAHLMLGATTSFGSGWTPISEVRRPRSRHEGCSPGTRFAWRNAFRALLLLGQWSSDGPDHSDAGGHSPSGWPTSHDKQHPSGRSPDRSDHYQIDTIVSIVCEHTTATSISTRQSNNQEGDRAWR